jgi:hypothetical protein
MGFLIDTCIWIDVERGSISPSDVARYTKDEAVFLSPVTLAELAFGAEMAKDERICQKRLAAMDRLRKKPFVIIDEKKCPPPYCSIKEILFQKFLKNPTTHPAGRSAHYRDVRDTFHSPYPGS